MCLGETEIGTGQLGSLTVYLLRPTANLIGQDASDHGDLHGRSTSIVLAHQRKKKKTATYCPCGDGESVSVQSGLTKPSGRQDARPYGSHVDGGLWHTEYVTVPAILD